MRSTLTHAETAHTGNAQRERFTHHGCTDTTLQWSTLGTCQLMALSLVPTKRYTAWQWLPGPLAAGHNLALTLAWCVVLHSCSSHRAHGIVH